MQGGVGVDHLLVQPRLLPGGAGPDDGLEVRVDPDVEESGSDDAPQSPRNVEPVEIENAPRIGEYQAIRPSSSAMGKRPRRYAASRRSG